MTNDEIRKNDEIRICDEAPGFGFRASEFGFLSSFVIRHSYFVIALNLFVPCPAK